MQEQERTYSDTQLETTGQDLHAEHDHVGGEPTHYVGIGASAVILSGTGSYPESIAADLPQNVLGKYFHKVEDAFRVSRSLREMVVFAEHNLIKNPPFTNIDLISCPEPPDLSAAESAEQDHRERRRPVDHPHQPLHQGYRSGGGHSKDSGE
jgi:hypothetical protein